MTPPAGAFTDAAAEAPAHKVKDDRRLLGWVLLIVGTFWFLGETGMWHVPSTLVLATVLIVLGMWQMCTARRRATGWPVIAGFVITMILLSSNVSIPHARFAHLSLGGLDNLGGDVAAAPAAWADVAPTYAATGGNVRLDLSQLPPLAPGQGVTPISITAIGGDVDLRLPAAARIDLSVRDIGGDVSLEHGDASRLRSGEVLTPPGLSATAPAVPITIMDTGGNISVHAVAGTQVS